jgi:hypothetical protein
VSRSWSDRLRVVIGGSAVATVRSRGVLGRKPAAAGWTALQGSREWAPALAALRASFEQRSAAKAAVVVSGRWCRFALLPWKDDLDEAEILTLARYVMEDRYGEAARDWVLAVDALRRGESVLACAIEAPLLRALEAACAEQRIRLDSVQPLFTAALNAHRQPGRGLRWDLLIEPDWWSWALVDGDALLAIGGQAAEGDWPVLSRMLANEALRAGVIEPDLPVRVLASAAGSGIEVLPAHARLARPPRGASATRLPVECTLAAYAG